MQKIARMAKEEIIASNQLIAEVIGQLDNFKLTLPGQIISLQELKKLLSEMINQLVSNNFSRLVSILYRLDISERKLKELLKTATDKSAGDIIAEMIIDRQIERIRTRNSMAKDDNYCDEEKW